METSKSGWKRKTGWSFFLQQVTYAFCWNLAKKNNELPLKLFQIFLDGGAWFGKSFSVTVLTEYLIRVLRCPNQNLDSHLFLWLDLMKNLSQVSIVLCTVHFIILLSQDWNPTSIRSQVTKLFICWEASVST